MIIDFIGGTKGWMSRVVVFPFVETVDVDGGTIEMIESLARFSRFLAFPRL